ncbi:alpha/beta hydrolase [Fredinandcohnia humi]
MCEESLEFVEISSNDMDDYVLIDGEFQSSLGGAVTLWLTVPKQRDKKLPAIIFMHPGQGNRNSFLEEGKLLASKGVISLMMDAPFARTSNPKSQNPGIGEIVENVVDIETYKQTIADTKRSISLLTSLEYVDSERILYVGHSFGATWGGVLAGMEERICGFLLMAGFSSLSEWHRNSQHPLAELVRSYLTHERFIHFCNQIALMDAKHFIKNAAPAEVYFQFARDDDFVPLEQAETYYESSSFPKKISWYQTDHLFSTCEEATADRMAWYIEKLKLDELR